MTKRDTLGEIGFWTGVLVAVCGIVFSIWLLTACSGDPGKNDIMGVTGSGPMEGNVRTWTPRDIEEVAILQQGLSNPTPVPPAGGFICNPPIQLSASQPFVFMYTGPNQTDWCVGVNPTKCQVADWAPLDPSNNPFAGTFTGWRPWYGGTELWGSNNIDDRFLSYRIKNSVGASGTPTVKVGFYTKHAYRPDGYPNTYPYVWPQFSIPQQKLDSDAPGYYTQEMPAQIFVGPLGNITGITPWPSSVAWVMPQQCHY